MMLTSKGGSGATRRWPRWCIPIPRAPKASTRVGDVEPLCEGNQPPLSLDAAGPGREGELLRPKDLQAASD